MKENYFEQYSKIVKGNMPPKYKTPEEQGNSIKQFTLLKPNVEIEYSSGSGKVTSCSDTLAKSSETAESPQKAVSKKS